MVFESFHQKWNLIKLHVSSMRARDSDSDWLLVEIEVKKSVSQADVELSASSKAGRQAGRLFGEEKAFKGIDSPINTATEAAAESI